MEQARRDILTGIKSWDKHMAGIMIHILTKYCRAYRTAHGSSIVQYRFQRHMSRVARKLREERLIKGYVRRFGEVPPLNSTIPNRHYDWAFVIQYES
jgi:hypothetical protein